MNLRRSSYRRWRPPRRSSSRRASPAGHARRGEAQARHHSVELLECSRGKLAKRWALFRGEMTQIPEGAGCECASTLSEKVGADPWRAVQAPGLGEWLDASPGVPRFAFRQKVAGLEGDAYRALTTSNGSTPTASVG